MQSKLVSRGRAAMSILALALVFFVALDSGPTASAGTGRAAVAPWLRDVEATRMLEADPDPVTASSLDMADTQCRATAGCKTTVTIERGAAPALLEKLVAAGAAETELPSRTMVTNGKRFVITLTRVATPELACFRIAATADGLRYMRTSLCKLEIAHGSATVAAADDLTDHELYIALFTIPNGSSVGN